jgi:hypothetical protein
LKDIKLIEPPGRAPPCACMRARQGSPIGEEAGWRGDAAESWRAGHRGMEAGWQSEVSSDIELISRKTK